MTPTDLPPLCGVVVTYQPEDNVLDNLRAVVAECGRVIVVDNASSAIKQARLAALPGIEIIALPENIGVAAALNLGARRATEIGCEWIVTLDQDSRPEVGMAAELWRCHLRHPDAAIVGPCIVEGEANEPAYRWVRRHQRYRWLFQRVECHGTDLEEVTALITSGSLVELAAWQLLGGFDAALFIDYVDIDYCLRVARASRAIVVAGAARLHHKLGARQPRRVLGKDLRPMHHAAFRHYYMARNRVRVWRRHACAVPHWAAFDLCFAGYNTLRVLAFEPNKWPKLKAILLGTWDGLRGKSGRCPPWREAQFGSRVTLLTIG